MQVIATLEEADGEFTIQDITVASRNLLRKPFNPSQAVLWGSCTRIMTESMENAGFAIGSSSPQATEDAKALASACPDAYAEMPVFPKLWYTVAVDAIEKNGGPSLIDRVAPAGWLIQRAMKARWPRCIDAARPYIAKARKDISQR